jgi:hypothetical protein
VTGGAWWKPAQPRWLMATGIISVLSLAIYFIVDAYSPWRPGRAAGLTFGWLAVVLFVNAAMYPQRRRQALPWGTAQRWLQIHIYGSTLAAVFVLVHVGFRLPHGLMGWGLFVLALWTTISGIGGALLQKWAPVALTRGGIEVLAPRAPALCEALLREADELLAGAADTLRDRYRELVRPVLAAAAVPRLMPAGSPAALKAVSVIQAGAGAADRDRVTALDVIVRDRIAIEDHLAVQRLLRGWLWLHVPPAIVLLGLLALHVLAVVLY